MKYPAFLSSEAFRISCGIFVVYTCALLLIAYFAGQSTLDRLVVGAPASDTEEYISLAHTMLSTGRFAITPESPTEFFRTPGYPAFLALLFIFVQSSAVIAFAQIVLTAATAGLIYALGNRFFSRAAGIGAALLYALDPTVVLKAFTAYTETLFVCAIVGAVALLTTKRSDIRMVFAGGMLIGFSALVRPVALYIAPVFLLWLVWRYRHTMPSLLRALCACILGIALFTVPWMVRNESLAGQFSLLSLGAYNTLFANIAEYEVFRTGQGKEAVWKKFYEQLGTTDSYAVHSYAYASEERSLVLQYLDGHWLSYAAFHGFKSLPFFFGSSIEAAQLALHQQGILTGPEPIDVNLTAALLSREGSRIMEAFFSAPVKLFEMIGWLCVWALALAAVFVVKGARDISVFFWLIILAFAIVTGPIAMPPYRMPAEPFLLILSSAGALSLFEYMRARLKLRRRERGHLT